jgi:imidazolonepropionase
MTADFIVLHARQLMTCAGPAPRRGPSQADAGAIEDGAVASLRGSIVFAGRTADMPLEMLGAPRIVDLQRRQSVVPGFVDAHTHAVFAGDRGDELRRRLAGASYAEIAEAGGGIVSTVAATRAASESALATAAMARLDDMLANGTTTCEIKSGYGLTTESELKLLRVIENVGSRHAVSVIPTFMGAHEVPVEYRHSRAEYVDLVVDEMIPAVARQNVARWCDVFCEEGVFTPAESTRILRAGLAAGLSARIHADELGSTGGSQVAAAVGARSADHLIFASSRDISALTAANVTATLLPIAAFYLKLGRFAPARQMIEAGVPVALATDVNPGAGLSPSMPFAMALACFGMGLTFEEALVAATLNGAWSLDLAAATGSVEYGKAADFVVVDGDAINIIRVGAAPVAAVVKRGRLVHGTLPMDPTE